jgi:hypothetical protein
MIITFYIPVATVRKQPNENAVKGDATPLRQSKVLINNLFP